MNRVLVTGGGGFIGKALVRELVSRGVEVTVVGRNPYPELTALGVRCLQGDIRDRRFLEQVTVGQDTVFHVAAKAGIWGPRQEYVAINVTGTKNVIAACRKNGVPKLVYTSTPSVVFDRQSLEGVDESIPYARRPLCHYAASKIVAEQAVLRANGDELRTIALRPHLVWGPGDQHLIPRLLARGRAGQLKIVGSGRNRVDIAYIDNVIHAHLLASENLHASGSGAGQAFFIGQDEPVELWSWINDLFNRLQIPPVTQRLSFNLAYVAGALLESAHAVFGKEEEPRMTRFLAHQLAHSHWFSHRKARELLGYRQQVTTDEGMERLVGWVGDSAGTVP
ncbi:NAD(P)H steroid dehydrogenase [Desulfobulbus propionicus DSM 2032]|jgi:nucleoside-diphosphate-sugar epimerase|uniref:NAD(P)H steroid dehydrogenase n=1 Tax=Desulfobulbus propionicus (strain ATCC 33891 / DSM 2032 / VKM B-1956 / 1pr3) TaxID=577650 RepID=A0A7U3YNT2_DESPD|nr:NAD-dependent epimerase/dehydratase family protein [Desulfobulbus propionicus]ADW18794.1 NAD(P)H steroid dehydrogenase [Desulfobulbus propionicus DSM 2032]